MYTNKKTVLLVSMPFAEVSIPSIQLSLLESYLKTRDINTTSRHLYLKAVDFYGLSNYNFLINSPNDSYAAQIVFSKYVFPEHWKKNTDIFRYFYNNTLAYDKNFLEHFSFDQYVERTNNFYNWACNHIKWEDFDIIGFTLNYGQFLPSLAVARYIKETYPEKIIVFGGSSTIGELGKRVLKIFNWIDCIISGDGEESLLLLASNGNIESIPGLIYRENNKIKLNKNNNTINLNQLPIPDFSSFYQELNKTNTEVQQYYSLRGRLPIEFSRGCWWNNCTFCNIRAYHKRYREKTVERFTEELNVLSDTYKILSFQFIGNTLPQDNYRELCEHIIDLGKDFNFYAEARAGRLTSEDYKLLKNAGFINIQTGVEAFSSHYLEKMNKGTKAIDNIAALKFCKENGIKNTYNIIVNYPNEEPIDFEETKRNIEHVKQYLDPPQISTFYVGYGSLIYEHPERFNIEKLDYKKVDKIMYPLEILAHNFCFFYSFTRKQPVEKNNWRNLVDKWNIEREMLKLESIKNGKTADRYIFYFVDGESFLRIYDKRSLNNIQIYNLNKAEREIFLSCLDVSSLNELREKLPDIPKDVLFSTLKTFEEDNLIFREDDLYLSLPLSYKKIMKREINKEKTTKCLVYS